MAGAVDFFSPTPSNFCIFQLPDGYRKGTLLRNPKCFANKATHLVSTGPQEHMNTGTIHFTSYTLQMWQAAVEENLGEPDVPWTK